MLNDAAADGGGGGLPPWVPEAARHYIVHTECGRPIRALARGAGCHASTVLRQVRKTESRRDDLLIDEALVSLGAIQRAASAGTQHQAKDALPMTIQTLPTSATPGPATPIPTTPGQATPSQTAPSQATIEREARRILRRLCEPSACLAVARDMEKAVVVRETEDGRTTRTAVVERPVAQAMALKDWISCATPGRISRYFITSVGRSALKRLLAQDHAERAGFAEAPARFGDQHRCYEEREMAFAGDTPSRRLRYNLAESPVAAMARRRDKAGNPFLNNDLVNAAERLREDFELAQMGPRTAQNWDRFLTGGARGSGSADSGIGDGPTNARNRVSAALHDLGPGLGDVVMRVCCFLEGLEAAEKRMGWSARSGKVVLRIALQRLKRHYDGLGQGGAMIG